MSWKCVLVGLALVLPGTLLIVEGRHTDQNRGGTDDGASLDKLLDLLKKRVLNKKDATRVEDVENSDSAIYPGASNNNPQPPPSIGTDESQGTSRGRKEQEINAQVHEAKASPLTHSRAGQGDERGAQGTAAFLTKNSTFLMVVTACTVLAAIAIVGAGVCWYKYHKRAKAASVVEYPAYGVTGPTKDHLPSPGDRKLAKSAQMYHYQHQKQQMIAMEKANGNMKHDASDDESEEDNVEGDYTVYECPGLAPTGEMEVRNPLFRGDETPSTPVPEESQQPQEDK